MNDVARPTTPAWLMALQAAVILGAIALCAFPALRAPKAVSIFQAVSFVNLMLKLRRDWKTGYLRMTPRQIHERAKAGERLPRDPLGNASVIATLVAQWTL